MPINNKFIAEFIALFEGYSLKHGLYKVFYDFIELTSIVFSNQVARELGSCYGSVRKQAKAREESFEIIKAKYTQSEFENFAHMIAFLQLAFNDEPFDWLGHIFQMKELHSEDAGQFFTPYSLCQTISDILMSKESIERLIKEKGFFTVSEPAVGAGAMIIPVAKNLRELGYKPENTFCVMATDIDKRAVYMSYCQFSLMGIPAVIYHGDALSLETWDTWFTPAFVLNNWGLKLQKDLVLSSDDKPKFDVVSPVSHGHLASTITLQQINLF